MDCPLQRIGRSPFSELGPSETNVWNVVERSFVCNPFKVFNVILALAVFIPHFWIIESGPNENGEGVRSNLSQLQW